MRFSRKQPCLRIPETIALKYVCMYADCRCLGASLAQKLLDRSCVNMFRKTCNQVRIHTQTVVKKNNLFWPRYFSIGCKLVLFLKAVLGYYLKAGVAGATLHTMMHLNIKLWKSAAFKRRIVELYSLECCPTSPA